MLLFDWSLAAIKLAGLAVVVGKATWAHSAFDVLARAVSAGHRGQFVGAVVNQKMRCWLLHHQTKEKNGSD